MRLLLLALWVASYAGVNTLAKLLMTDTAQGRRSLFQMLLQPPSLWYFLGCVSLCGVCGLLYVFTLRVTPLSVAGPIFLSLGTLTTFLLGVLYFNESPNPMKVGGVLLISLGCVFVFLGNSDVQKMPREGTACVVPSLAQAESVGPGVSGAVLVNAVERE